MEWFRWHHGAVSDDKWPLIARKSVQPVAVVIAVWAALLECASQAGERGSLSDFDPESMDALLQVPDGTCQAVVDAMSEGKKPRIVDGKIAKWGDRQPLREDGSAERARAYRERKKAEESGAYGGENASERTPNAPRTQTNTDQIREEKIREELRSNTIGDLEKLDHAPALSDSVGVCADNFTDAPGMEFVDLRELYSRLGREEGELEGFAEYKQAKAGKSWPGMARITQAITDFSELDDEWRRGFSPGLAKFIREKRWTRQPRAAPQLVSPAQISPTTYAQAQDAEKRQRAQRVKEKMEAERNGGLRNDTRGIGKGLPALAASYSAG